MLGTNKLYVYFIVNTLIIFIKCDVQTFSKIRIALLRQDGQEYLIEWCKNILDIINSNYKYEILDIKLGEEIDSMRGVCPVIAKYEPRITLDVSWLKTETNCNLFNNSSYIYLGIDASLRPFIEFLETYLKIRNVESVVIILEQSDELDQIIFPLLNTTRLKMYIIESMDSTSIKKIQDLKPMPTSYVLLASTTSVESFLTLESTEHLLKLPDRWILMCTDVHGYKIDRYLLKNKLISLLTIDNKLCCVNKTFLTTCTCEENLNLQKSFLQLVLQNLISNLEVTFKDQLLNYNSQISGFRLDEFFNDTFLTEYSYLIGSTLKMNISGNIEIGNNISSKVVGKYENKELIILENSTMKPIKAFYKVGITHALPWSFKINNSVTGTSIWSGYCVDFTSKIAEMLNFNYEFVEPNNGTFGEKINGIWDGVIGDLVTGETDFAVTAITMTADREEVVDFVAPYFEQTGITIVMRKPVRKTSLFKFMTVLKLEVWLSIVAALVATGCMVWLLDKYSPYSARNNKAAYHYPCRDFTLKESFWFALTSFTPQGGGEAPKALSGRTLVAAYWLFVVLMLATFTANLAAFLTVERMQAPVQSLEQLARQSRINYTVVKDSDTHKYFINMKNAEDTLYRMWKELTLNATTDDLRYRVWDYPIKEQYGHILLAINDSNPVANAEEGFNTVNAHLDADYAFIHDSSEIKYEISRNCNLTEVGEVFAEKPYAVAVQQGSRLQDDISKVILKLQKDRFFDELQAKYWNHSSKGYCPSTDDNEGITLESLGGVFIATLFGLALSLLTLVGEVIYYRKKRKSNTMRQKSQKIGSGKLSLLPPPFIDKGKNPGANKNTTKQKLEKSIMNKVKEESRIKYPNLHSRNTNKIHIMKESFY